MSFEGCSCMLSLSSWSAKSHFCVAEVRSVATETVDVLMSLSGNADLAPHMDEIMSCAKGNWDVLISAQQMDSRKNVFDVSMCQRCWSFCGSYCLLLFQTETVCLGLQMYSRPGRSSLHSTSDGPCTGRGSTSAQPGSQTFKQRNSKLIAAKNEALPFCPSPP